MSTIFTPLFLRSVNMAGDMVPYFNDASELFITRDLAVGDRYSVFAPVFEGGSTGLNQLVNAAAGTEDKYYDEFYDLYMQLPGHLEQKLFDDVFNIVQNAETPYEKALTLMNYLKKYYRYTLTPDEPPENQDFVTYFLYREKEGYCTYFASAMTVMSRIAGLPARYVEGFLAQPSSDGFAYVTGLDAHAWTEVYFEGFGWVPFDPTPNQHDNNEPPPNEEPEPTPSPTPSPEPDTNDNLPTPTPNPQDNPEDPPSPEPSVSPEPQDNPDPEDHRNNPFPWWILLVLAAIGAAAARVALRSPDRVAAQRQSEKEKVFVYGAATARLLGYANYRPKAGETPLSFAKRVDAVHYFRKQVTPLWRILSLSNYSRLQPGVAQTGKARDTYREIYKESKPLRKLRFLAALLTAKRFYTTLDTVLSHEEPQSPYTWNTRNLRKIRQRPEDKKYAKDEKRKPGSAAPTSKPNTAGKRKKR
ncbi:MAG: transglutaminase domain-containing protein [Firmicutes bacterium]|nr:transglutaminase domain-containing protein [Bacillota bacterium]